MSFDIGHRHLAFPSHRPSPQSHAITSIHRSFEAIKENSFLFVQLTRGSAPTHRSTRGSRHREPPHPIGYESSVTARQTTPQGCNNGKRKYENLGERAPSGASRDHRLHACAIASCTHGVFDPHVVPHRAHREALHLFLIVANVPEIAPSLPTAHAYLRLSA